MRKIVITLLATFAAALLLGASATGASAHRYRPGCNCGPVAPTTHYKLVHPAKHVTRYHDVNVTRRVQRVHRVITVTRVQPIIHIHEVTRVHHHTLVLTRNAYEHRTAYLSPIHLVTHSTRNYYDCHCGY